MKFEPLEETTSLKKKRVWLSLPLVALVFFAWWTWGQLTGSATAVATFAPQPTETAVFIVLQITAVPQPMVTAVATITPQPTATPQPTVTAVATITPQPTATPQPTVTAVATSTPPPTATAVNVAGTAAVLVGDGLARQRPLLLGSVALSTGASIAAFFACCLAVLALFRRGDGQRPLPLPVPPGPPKLPPCPTPQTAKTLITTTPPKITVKKKANNPPPITDLLNQLSQVDNRLELLQEVYKANGINVPMSLRPLTAQETALTKTLLENKVSMTLLCLVIFNGKNTDILNVVRGAKKKDG